MDSRLEQFEGGVRPSTLIEVRGGSFMMGDESAWAYPGDGEGPVHEVVAGAPTGSPGPRSEERRVGKEC